MRGVSDVDLPLGAHVKAGKGEREPLPKSLFNVLPTRSCWNCRVVATSPLGALFVKQTQRLWSLRMLHFEEDQSKYTQASDGKVPQQMHQDFILTQVICSQSKAAQGGGPSEALACHLVTDGLKTHLISPIQPLPSCG